MINNPEIQFNSILADRAFRTNSSMPVTKDENNFLTDAVLNPIGMIEAAGADTGVALYNLVDAVGEKTGAYDLEDKTTEGVLQMFAEQGFADGAEYYRAHPLATQMASLLVGGLGSFKVANLALNSSLRKGTVLYDTTAKELGFMARAKNAAAVQLETNGVASEGFIKAMSKFNLMGGGEIAIDAAVQETVFAGLMSQHTLLEDYSWGDWILGAGIYGGLSYATKGLNARFDRVKATTDEFTRTENEVIMGSLGRVPDDVRNTPTGAVLIQRDATALKLKAEDPNLPPAIRKSAAIAQRQQEDNALRSWDAAIDPKLQVNRTSKDITDQPVIVQNLDRAGTRLRVENPEAVVGIQNIKPLGTVLKEAHVGLAGISAGRGFTHSLKADVGVVADGLRAGETVEQIALRLDLPIAEIKRAEWVDRV